VYDPGADIVRQLDELDGGDDGDVGPPDDPPHPMSEHVKDRPATNPAKPAYRGTRVQLESRASVKVRQWCQKGKRLWRSLGWPRQSPSSANSARQPRLDRRQQQLPSGLDDLSGTARYNQCRAIGVYASLVPTACLTV
jgi:hypothetical protein